MKKILILLIVIGLVTVSAFVIGGFYFFDQAYFLCPIKYQGSILIRSDGRGEGFFAAHRNGRRLHEGIDLWAPVGTQVLACRSGVVLRATRNRGMGKYIILRHRSGITTIYGHLSEIYVKQNDVVRQGKVIGAVGKTGNANFRDIQPHLHFEVRQEGLPQDPMTYLSKAKI
jgi:murein DD-endopeptidase MepM/ murein hydrolase activator NlpD